ncbi:Uncharacterized protein OBRU01_11713 [Operophtera brumata]|uniref:Uncharacterized protein n=1 Tax=Operophtera brumata TaxID=104452 RepID=A0A0L7LC83_OPEBR|nr:Uncharacterized protein OBRU01_11713 [Operophtera brumata]
MGIGKITEFNVRSGNWNSYVERVEMYFKVNSIKEELWLPTLIAAMGDEAYELLSNLKSPVKPSEKTFSTVTKLMKDHLQPKPSLKIFVHTHAGASAVYYSNGCHYFDGRF